MKKYVTALLLCSLLFSGCKNVPEPTAKVEMWHTGGNTARIVVTTKENVKHIDFKVYELEKE